MWWAQKRGGGDQEDLNPLGRISSSNIYFLVWGTTWIGPSIAATSLGPFQYFANNMTPYALITVLRKDPSTFEVMDRHKYFQNFTIFIRVDIALSSFFQADSRSGRNS